jgi:flagellar biosynthesis protein
MKKEENPKFAAALKYRREIDGAPKITAKGRGELAERIIAIAREEGVPLVEDNDLAKILNLSDIGEEIPHDLYAVVAEVFAFLYRVNNKVRGKS